MWISGGSAISNCQKQCRVEGVREMDVPEKEIHLIAIDPGKVTGWAHWIIPRRSMYEPGYPSEVIDHYTGEIHGRESDQVAKICRFIREVQGLSFRVGPAVVCEGFDFGSPLSDPEVYSPVRIGAMLKFCFEQKNMKLTGDARLIFQSRTMAKKTASDKRLRAWGLWVPSSRDHERDAERHAVTALRRARARREFRDRLWNSDILKVWDGDQ
jgi:hypothetical protein